MGFTDNFTLPQLLFSDDYKHDECSCSIFVVAVFSLFVSCSQSCIRIFVHILMNINIVSLCLNLCDLPIQIQIACV